VAPTLLARSRFHLHLSTLGYRHNCHRFSHSGRSVMPSGPSLCSCKRVCKDDLGSPLQSDGMTFWHGENCGHSLETFLLAKTSTRRQKVYHIFHFMCHFQANHKEARLIHLSSYPREALGVHLNGLHVWPFVHQARN
jgi:hypothetical protein